MNMSREDLIFIAVLSVITTLLSIAAFHDLINLPKTGLIEFIVEFSLEFISESKYGAIFILMLLESALVPIPSEIVMPFSGFLCYLGELSLILVVLVASIANLVGSLIAYWFGIRYGRSFLIKYGKYLFIGREHIEFAEELFNKYGEVTILVSRMLPAIRTVISFPAGIGKMRISKFILYTFIGSLPWNFALTYIGFTFGENWFILFEIFKKIDLILVIDLLIVLLWLIKKLRKV